MIMEDFRLGPSRDIGLISFHSMRRKAQIYRNLLNPPSLRTQQNCIFLDTFGLDSLKVTVYRSTNGYCRYLFGHILSIFQRNDYGKTFWVPKTCHGHQEMVIYPLNVEWVFFDNLLNFSVLERSAYLEIGHNKELF